MATKQASKRTPAARASASAPAPADTPAPPAPVPPSRRPDETVHGGRYIVGGVLVDANGQPIEE